MLMFFFGYQIRPRIITSTTKSSLVNMLNSLVFWSIRLVDLLSCERQYLARLLCSHMLRTGSSDEEIGKRKKIFLWVCISELALVWVWVFL
jgi:hypothetical protein